MTRHTGCYLNKDSWKIQAVSRQCSLPVDWKYIVLNMNAAMEQPAFVLATKQEFDEKDRSECKSVEGEKTERADAEEQECFYPTMLFSPLWRNPSADTQHKPGSLLIT